MRLLAYLHSLSIWRQPDQRKRNCRRGSCPGPRGDRLRHAGPLVNDIAERGLRLMPARLLHYRQAAGRDRPGPRTPTNGPQENIRRRRSSRLQVRKPHHHITKALGTNRASVFGSDL